MLSILPLPAESPYSGKARPFGQTGGLHPQLKVQSAFRGLHRQLFAATATAGSQDPAAVLGGHPGTESVHFAALTLLGLIRTEHSSTLLIQIVRVLSGPAAPKIYRTA